MVLYQVSSLCIIENDILIAYGKIGGLDKTNQYDYTEVIANSLT